jgi:hypothetical protein
MPEDRMLERLEKLEGIVETTVQILPPLINDLSRRIDGLREEVQGMAAQARRTDPGVRGQAGKANPSGRDQAGRANPRS